MELETGYVVMMGDYHDFHVFLFLKKTTKIRRSFSLGLAEGKFLEESFSVGWAVSEKIRPGEDSLKKKKNSLMNLRNCCDTARQTKKPRSALKRLGALFMSVFILFLVLFLLLVSLCIEAFGSVEEKCRVKAYSQVPYLEMAV